MNKKRGGKRQGAGRKPKEDKKIPLTIGVLNSKIQSVGGIEQAKQKLKEYTNNW